MPAGLKDPAFAADLDKLFPSDGAEPATPPANPPAPATPPPAAPAAPAKEPAKPDAKADEDWKEAEPPESVKSPKGQESWRSREKGFAARLEKERAAFAKEKSELAAAADKFKADLEAAKKASPGVKVEDLPEFKGLKSQHEALTKQLEDYSERLALVDVEKHPKFQAYFTQRTEAAMNLAKSAGGDRAVELLKLPDSAWRTEQLEALAAEIGTIKGGLLTNAMARLDEITAERNAEIARAQTNYKTMKEQEALTTAQQRESLSKTFEAIRAEVTGDKGLPVFAQKDDPEWNKGVQESLTLAQHIYGGELKPEERARAAFWSAAAPRLLSALQTEQASRAEEVGKLNTRITELEAEIAKTRTATPAPGSETQTTDTPAPTKGGIAGMFEDMEARGVQIR